MGTDPGVRSLEALLLGDRDVPVIVLSQAEESLEPVFPPAAVRAVVGPDARIYYVPGEYLLRGLRGTLGHTLALGRGGARIFWPGLCTRSDPAEHPLVLPLAGERECDALAELARRFDLSRPHVRREMKLVEDDRALLQQQLAGAQEAHRNLAQDLRDAKIARHAAMMRAESAERRLQDRDR